MLTLIFFLSFHLDVILDLQKRFRDNIGQLPLMVTSHLTMLHLQKLKNYYWYNTIKYTINFIHILPVFPLFLSIPEFGVLRGFGSQSSWTMDSLLLKGFGHSDSNQALVLWFCGGWGKRAAKGSQMLLVSGVSKV